MSVQWMKDLENFLIPPNDEGLTLSHPGLFNKDLLFNNSDEEL